MEGASDNHVRLIVSWKNKTSCGVPSSDLVVASFREAVASPDFCESPDVVDGKMTLILKFQTTSVRDACIWCCTVKGAE